MQAVIETIFDVVYLSTVLTIGFIMVKGSKKGDKLRLFGVMALVLGFGDAFHLIPRAYALLTNGLEANVVSLGIGKLITSITMTGFYWILYLIWKSEYGIVEKTGLDRIVLFLCSARLILCLMPQNGWLTSQPPVSWGIIRNIPFAMIGLILIYGFYIQSRKNKDGFYRHMWLAITLSFAFYIPVVIWSNQYALVGVLMIPKTLAYVWVIVMGYSEYRTGGGHKNAKAC